MNPQGIDKMQGAYLIYGEEAYGMEQFIEEVKRRTVQPEFASFNLQIFQGSKATVAELSSSLEVLPLMAKRRLVILYEIQEFINREHPEDYFYDQLLNLDSTVLLMVERGEKIKKNQKLYRRMQKESRAYEFKPLNRMELRRFIDEYLSHQGRRMDSKTRELFIQRTNYESRNVSVDLNRVVNELDKLISASTDTIGEELINASMEKSSDESIFDLLEFMTRGRGAECFRALDELIRREEPVPRILFMINRHIRLLLGYKLLSKNHRGLEEIRKTLGISPFEAKKIAAQSQNFSEQALRAIYPILCEADHRLKTTHEDERLLLEYVISKIMYKKTENF